jgi:lipoteichoic acid synthase
VQQERAENELRLRAMLLLVIAYDVTLQAIRIAYGSAELIREAPVYTTLDSLRLLGSPLLATCALMFACNALLALVGERAERVMLSLIQALLAAFVVLETAAHVYFMRSGGNLDASVIAYWAPRIHDLELVASGEVSGAQWIAMGGVLLALVAASRFAGKVLRPAPQAPTRRMGLAMLALSVAMGYAGYRLRPPLVVDAGPVLNLLEGALRRGPDLSRAELNGLDRRLPFDLELRPSGAGKRPNVIIVILESTRAAALTRWNPDLPTTPFLNELARKSLVVERFHSVIPHTSKALTAILCGLQPSHNTAPMAVRLGLATRCLPRLLREQGYQTAYFQTANPHFDERERAVSAMGFERLVTPDQYPDRGFQQANFLGPEDESLLDPMLDWVREHKEKPFLLTFLTVNAHHRVYPLTRYGVAKLSPDEAVNTYLNAVRYDDILLKKLVCGLKRLGVYRDTILVVVGDHGDAFAEHRLSIHDRVPYEEVLHVPLIIHDPRAQHPAPGVVRDPGNQLDVLPTVVELLGFEPSKGAFQGKSLLHPIPRRALMSSCYGTQVCLARLQDDEKYIHHFDRRPDQLFDLSKDPGERDDLAALHPARIQELREQVLAWDRAVKTLYFFYSNGGPPPPVATVASH